MKEVTVTIRGWAGRTRIRYAGEQVRPGRWFATGAAAGALLAYFFDPERGRRRRRLVGERGLGAVRHSGRRIARGGRATRLQALGRTKGAIHRLHPPAREPFDDVTLAHKVESVLFRDPRVPKGQISINAENGTVFLRGQVESPDLIDGVMDSVRKINGVVEVENLLHLPGTEAPHPARRGADRPASVEQAGQ